MFLSENLEKKWGAILDHPDLPKIKDPYRRAVTASSWRTRKQRFAKNPRF